MYNIFSKTLEVVSLVSLKKHLAFGLLSAVIGLVFKSRISWIPFGIFGVISIIRFIPVLVVTLYYHKVLESVYNYYEDDSIISKYPPR